MNHPAKIYSLLTRRLPVVVHQYPRYLPALTTRRSFSSEEEATTEFRMAPKRTSGRRHKRLQRKRQHQRQAQQKVGSGQDEAASNYEKEEDSDDEYEEDDRTWRSILFPLTIHEPEEDPIPWPKTYQGWVQAHRETWALYRASWDGFFSNLSLQEKQTKKDPQQEEEQAQTIIMEADEIKANFQRNLQTTKEEGSKLVKQVQEQTGIHSYQDLKAFAREMMTVATAMLAEFMKEYRTGRDEEVEKMMTEYFQELEGSKGAEEEEEPPKRRRKRKRRIPYLLRAE